MTQLTERLDRFDNRLRSMETELVELRRLAHAEAQAAPATPAPARAPEPPLWAMLEPAQAPAAAARPAPSGPVPGTVPGTGPSRPPRKPREPLDLSVLLGARALAWTGGAVTLLGVVFFFVLAVDRGWIGPSARITLGAAASAALLGAGVWLRRAYGDTYASVSAAGAGIAGFYATLLAAAALYDLIPAPLALTAAAAIAALGAGVALAWGSQTLASLGLVGAMLVPVPVEVQDGITATAAMFACLVLAAATVVAVRRGWHGLLVASVLVTALQAISFVTDEQPHGVAVAIAFWLVYAAGALWLALRNRISYLPASLLMFSAAFGGWSAGFLFDGRTQGYALMSVASAYACASVALFRRERDVASVLWAIALTLAAIGAASLASGATLTIVWAAEAAVLAWLARRIAEPRFQLASLAWLGLAFVHGLAYDAPLKRLFEMNADAWRAAPSPAALAIALVLVGLSTFSWDPQEEGLLARLFSDLLDAQPWLHRGAFAVAGATAVYAGSLAIVSLPSSWDRGHVLVAALWSFVAVALIAAGKRVSSLSALAASVALVLAYDLPQITAVERSWAFGIVALAALVVAVGLELRSRLTLELPAVVAAATSAVLAAGAAIELYDHRREGTALLLLALVFGTVGTSLVRRRRDFASVLGLLALALAVPGSIELLNGTMLVLAWAAGAAALAYLARFEERLQWAALALFGLALAHTLIMEAQPRDLFVAQRRPGDGIPAVLLVVAAAAELAVRSRKLRAWLVWLGGGLGLYAATLMILELAEILSSASIETAFQRGHTAVSSLWGVIGLALLYTGLKRARRELQIGGFVLFGISLVKLFVYDLAFLSSIARAFSFLAVGALILVAGFFYQRLAGAQTEART
jgi:uncharacterized membrane protein